MMLAFQLDFISEAYESADWLTEAMQSPAISEDDLFAGITVFYDHFEDEDGFRVSRDTGILVEYYDDVDDFECFGIVNAWAYDMYLGEPDVERAYVIAEDKSTSATPRFEDIRPICEVNKREDDTQPLPALPYAPATAGETARESGNQGLFQSIMPAIAAFVFSGVAS